MRIAVQCAFLSSGPLKLCATHTNFHRRLKTYAGFPHHKRVQGACKGTVPKLRSGVRRVQVLDTAVVTSARRWLRKGIWWTTIFNQFIISAWHLGVSPFTLARWYYRV